MSRAEAMLARKEAARKRAERAREEAIASRAASENAISNAIYDNLVPFVSPQTASSLTTAADWVVPGVGAAITAEDSLDILRDAETPLDYALGIGMGGLAAAEMVPLIGKAIGKGGRAAVKGGMKGASDDVLRFATGESGALPVPGWGGVREVSPSIDARVTDAVLEVPELEEVLPFIHEAEMGGIRRDNADAIVRAFRAVDQDALTAAANAGDAKRGWYGQSSKAVRHVLGDDTDRFTALLSATSPQTSVESNLENTVNIWKNWVQAGRPQDRDAIIEIMGRSVQGDKGVDSVLDAWKNNSIQALTGDDPFALSGPKVGSFGPNVAGDLSRFTGDTHAADGMGFDQTAFAKRGQNADNPSGFGPNYIGAAAANRDVAQQMGLEPANIQEMSWSFTKPLKELRAAEGLGGRSTMELLEAGDLTEDMIRDTPDFATLLQDPRYGQPLRDAGYGPQLDTLAPPDAPGYRDATPDPEGLQRAADIVERNFQRGAYTSRTAPYRSGAGGTAGDGYLRGQPGSLGAIEGVQLTPSEGFTKAVEPLGVDAPTFIRSYKRSAPAVHAHAEGLRNAIPENVRGAVDLPTVRDYRTGTALVTDGGSVLVKADGEVSGLMKQGGGPKDFTASALQAATQEGGTWLNALDTVLPGMYGKSGFKPVARIKWVDDYAPEGWDYELMSDFNGGRPDVVFMVYDPKFKGTVTNGVGGKVFDDYDAAVEYTKREVDKLKAKR